MTTTARVRVERRLAPRHTAHVVLGGVVGALAAPVVWMIASPDRARAETLSLMAEGRSDTGIARVLAVLQYLSE